MKSMNRLATPSGSPTEEPGASPGGEPDGGGVLAAVGDIACAPGSAVTRTTCHHRGTAALLERGGALDARHLAGVLLLGDIQYEYGEPAEYRAFDESWGRVLERSSVRVLPVAGNHEYLSDDAPPSGCELVHPGQHACGFDGYFSSRTRLLDDGDADYVVTFGAGEPHPLALIVLDLGRCNRDAAACEADGRVVRFVRSALGDPDRNPPAACTVVAWHQARWSAVGHGDLSWVDPVWRALFRVPIAQRPDLVLNGHDHVYERYPRLDADGAPDPRGIPELVVGTGGRSISGLPITTAPFAGLAGFDASSFGVLRMRWSARDGSVTTAFVTESGDIGDRASHACTT
jgi:hypothetical protein